VRWRAVRAILAAALSLASCDAASHSASPPPSHRPFQFTSASGLALRDRDLPPGFKVHYESIVGPHDVGELLMNDTPTSAFGYQVLMNQHLLSSYARSFDFSDSKTKTIASIVMIFRGTDDAQQALSSLAGHAFDRGCKEVQVAMALGDASKACAGQFQYQDRTAGVITASSISLYFSTANAVAYIGISDDPGADNGQLIADLALKQIRVMRSFGAAELKERSRREASGLIL
jgi:hypothetical protein